MAQEAWTDGGCSPRLAAPSQWFAGLGAGRLEQRVGALERQQQGHEEQTREQNEAHIQAIEELTIGLREAQREISELQRARFKENEGVRGSRRFKSSEHSGQALYAFNQSMWDAALLCFFKEVSLVDKIVLASGLLLNHGLQILWLVVVWMDMIEDPYPIEKVASMLEWRVETGHSTFDGVKGQSQLELLCNKKLWSFEQNEYEEMYSYLFKPIPGWTLSCLALVLWVMVTMKEYRGTVEQALAIANLPAVQSGDHCVLESEDGGEVEVVGITGPSRILALLMVSIPRLGVVILISWMGCRYLAQTPALADIVLNAVGLSFVLDIDELIFEVLCTQRIRMIMEHLKPLPCRSVRSMRCLGSLQLKDIIRYVLTLGMILFACLVYLVPFHNNVLGAANALCGGKYDFSYNGGTAAQATIWLQNSSDFRGSCSSAAFNDYTSTFYAQYNFSMSRKARAEAKVDYGPIKRRVVLNYALKGCPPGQILGPLREDAEERSCTPVPETLTSSLPAAVTPGLAADPLPCERFRPELGAGTCKARSDGEACLWSHLSQDCEGDPPGSLTNEACTTPVDSLADPFLVVDACELWGMVGRVVTPHFNCRALHVCPDPYDCFMVRGALAVDYANATAFAAWDASLAAADALQGLPPTMAFVEQRVVAVGPVRRLGAQAQTVQAGTPWPGSPTSPPPPLGTDRTVLHFRIGPSDMNFVPENFFTRNATVAIQQYIAQSLPMAGVVLVSFANLSFLTYQEYEAELYAQDGARRG